MTILGVVNMKPDADPGGRAVQVVGLRLLTCWDCVFESRRVHESMSREC